jgi:hypothetical protein
LQQTLSSVGVNSNSRFFTDCYRDAAAINPRVEKAAESQACGDFLRARLARARRALPPDFGKYLNESVIYK